MGDIRKYVHILRQVKTNQTASFMLLEWYEICSPCTWHFGNFAS